MVAGFRQLDGGSAGWTFLKALLCCCLFKLPVVFILLAIVALNTIYQGLAGRARQTSACFVLANGVARAVHRILDMCSRAQKS